MRIQRIRFELIARTIQAASLRCWPAGVLMVLATTAPAYADTSGSIEGRVLKTHVAASHIAVLLRGEGTTRTVYTSADGTFDFTNVPFGTYFIEAQATNLGAMAAVRLQSDGVARVLLNLDTLKQIGDVHASAMSKGPSNEPISVTTIGHSQIAALPENVSIDRLIEQVPGVVRFSYNEPIAHGFHGVTYEIDGIPVPQASTAEFSEIIDPHLIDSIEVFTGAMPAEFGGARQGAVVNIMTVRQQNMATRNQGNITVGAGTNGDQYTTLHDVMNVGQHTQLFIDDSESVTARGLDSATFVPIHDSSNASSHDLRSISQVGAHDTLAVSVTQNHTDYQVPINTIADANDPITSPLSTDDVQREYRTEISAAYTKNAANGKSSTVIAPWYREDHVVYAGDTPNDLASTLDGQAGQLQSLNQDRRSTFSGLRLEHSQLTGQHHLKGGIDTSIENYQGNESINYFSNNASTPSAFNDNSAQRGTRTGVFIQDKWLPSEQVTIFGGLRYDHSTGYTSGSQISPRIETDFRVDEKNIIHGFYGRFYAAPFLEDTRLAAAILAGSSANQLPTYDLKPERDSYYEFGIAHTMSERARWYINFWKRDAVNVLDTTNLANTPLPVVFNNAIGVARGFENRIEWQKKNGDIAYISTTVSQALAGGVSGGTFLTCPPGTAIAACGNNDITLAPEDHDQTVAVNAGYTHRWGKQRRDYWTVSPQYGTGYPVEFQNGEGRLPPHLTMDLAYGRDAGHGASGNLGYALTIRNATNRRYLIKVNNGFNTTQWAEGTRIDFAVTKPF